MGRSGRTGSHPRDELPFSIAVGEASLPHAGPLRVPVPASGRLEVEMALAAPGVLPGNLGKLYWDNRPEYPPEGTPNARRPGGRWSEPEEAYFPDAGGTWELSYLPGGNVERLRAVVTAPPKSRNLYVYPPRIAWYVMTMGEPPETLFTIDLRDPG